MNTRALCGIQVSELGFGCMNLNHAYGPGVSYATAERLLRLAFDLGVTHFDTAALYGFGRNEEWVGAALKPIRERVLLASKCGMTGVDGKRVIDGRPETLKQTCAAALKRLQTDRIDLYYLHRWDKRVPIEDSVGALADLVRQGWIRAVGLSEVSAATLRRAHAVHPIAAVQNEYSLWTRNPELGLLNTCEELGIALVAFSPLGRGFLAGRFEGTPQFQTGDIRAAMPRFNPPHLERNLALLVQFEELARAQRCTKAQLALAWLLHKSARVLPIVGTTSEAHLREDLAAGQVVLSSETAARLEALFNSATVSGARYPIETLAEIDTEEFDLRIAS